MRVRLAGVALSCLLLLAVGGAAADRNDAPDRPGEEETLNREVWEATRGTPYADALRHVAQARATAPPTMRREVVLPNGWKLAPAGAQVRLGRLPWDAVLFADRLVVLNTGFYGKEGQELSVVDPEHGTVLETVHLPSMFPSARVGLDGDLYVSGGFERKIYRLDRQFKVVREYPVGGYAAGLAPLDRSHLVVATLVSEAPNGASGEGRVALLNTETGAVERETPAGYFPYAVDVRGGKVYVTLSGENALLVLDAALAPLHRLAVGRGPLAMCGDDRRLFVVGSASDELSIVDTAQNRVVTTWPLRRAGFRFGASATSCALDGGRLYVTEAELNAVAVLDAARGALVGLVPTGWYPTKVLVDGERLLVLSAKGVEPRRPNPGGPQPPAGGGQYVLTLLNGALSIVPRADVAPHLAAWTRQVDEGAPLWSPAAGIKVPVHHVFYVVKENRSYDQVLGDLGRGNGDPALTLFGRAVTPSHHRLAEDFVTLDAFFANGEISVLGHSFTTSGYASPFLEWLGNAAYSRRYKGYPFGTVPALFSPTYLWDALDAKRIDYRVYGEFYYLFAKPYQVIVDTYGPNSDLAKKFYARTMELASAIDRGKGFTALVGPWDGRANTVDDAERLLAAPDVALAVSRLYTGDDTLARVLARDPAFRRRFADFLAHYAFAYHGWDLHYSDLDRARMWKADFERQVRTGRVPALHYIWLPNDHTAGASAGFPTPAQLVAQNDAALGLIVETIARSPVWADSLILVVEDDAQNGPDHIDATRTVALAAGPRVRRGAVVGEPYDQLGLLRTIELLLGVDPLNLNDGLAVPMFGIFTDKPDTAVWTAPPPSAQLLDMDRARYEDLARAVREH